MAISIINRYPEHAELVSAMAELAQEEMEHFKRVLDLMHERGCTLTRDPGDEYAQALHTLIRKQEPDRLLDTLLVSSIIEARSCERFQLLADEVHDRMLAEFYRSLIASEASHRTMFVTLARQYFSREAVDSRLLELNEQEAAIVGSLRSEPVMHG